MRSITLSHLRQVNNRICRIIILMGWSELIPLLSLSSGCCAALPRGVTGLSALCVCGISLSYSLFNELGQDGVSHIRIVTAPTSCLNYLI